MRVSHLMQKAHAAMFRWASASSRESLGCSTSQLGVLYVLLEEDRQPISVLAKVLSVAKPGMTGLIDRMVQQGLVSKHASGADRRITFVMLTAKGRATALQGLNATRAMNARLLAPFSASEQKIIARFLHFVAEEAERRMSLDLSKDHSADDDTRATDPSND